MSRNAVANLLLGIGIAIDGYQMAEYLLSGSPSFVISFLIVAVSIWLMRGLGRTIEKEVDREFRQRED